MSFYAGTRRSENSRDTEQVRDAETGQEGKTGMCIRQAGLRDKMKVKVAESALFVQRLRSQQRMGPSAGDREVNLDISHEVQRTRQPS